MPTIILIDTKHRRNEKKRKGIKKSRNDNRRTSKRRKQLIGDFSGRYLSRILIKWMCPSRPKMTFPISPEYFVIT